MPFSGTALARRSSRAAANCESRTAEIQTLWPDSAGRAADPLRQAHEILLADAGLEKRAREQRDIRQEVRRQHVQVESEVEIDDAVGEQVVIEHLRIGQRVTSIGMTLFRRGRSSRASVGIVASASANPASPACA